MNRTHELFNVRWNAMSGLIGLVMLFLLSVAHAEPVMPVATPVVQTGAGQVQGLVLEGIHTFKGIPYGAPPTGKFRFLPPRKPAPFTGRIDATAFGAPAMQMASGSTSEPTSDFGLLLKTVFPTPAEMKIDNEDCLFLNVWTPGVGDGKKRPVMVWFHGGGYAYGSGSWPVYDGENLSRRGDVVVVTVNHRLNVFGYLHLAEILGSDYAGSGNAGMLDLVLSLEWVRDNITAFGGDPGNITIMGESGGGSKVSHLMAMESARGLFHKAVIQSGPGLTSTPKEEATANAKIILDRLGIGDPEKDLAKLQTVTADEILAAASAGGEIRFGPVLDGTVLKRHPFTPDAPAISDDIPVIIGYNKDEMTIFQASEPWFGKLTEEELHQRVEAMPKGPELLKALRILHPDYSPTHLFSAISSTRFTFGSQVLAERKAARKKAPVYMYMLTWETPVRGGILRTPHTLDLPFMFDTVYKSIPLVGAGPEPQKLADQMTSAWIAFAKTGSPNTREIPEWPVYDSENRATLTFNVNSAVVNDPGSEIRKILSQQ
jgi:para-nitrobenzyl esterase